MILPIKACQALDFSDFAFHGYSANADLFPVTVNVPAALVYSTWIVLSSSVNM